MGGKEMYMKAHTCNDETFVTICDEKDNLAWENGLVMEAELDASGNIIMPEIGKRAVQSIPGSRIWLYLTDAAGIVAMVNEDRCRICGERMDAESPYVICARCIRDVQEMSPDDETPESICS